MDFVREAEVVTEYLYGTRSRAAARSLLSSHSKIDPREDTQTRTEPYDIYFISSKQPRGPQQPDRRPKSLQRGATTPNSNMNDMKSRCTTSTCNYWPHCSEVLYSPSQSQPLMKVSQSYPTHRRVSIDSVISQSKERTSACSSPASLDIVDDLQPRKTQRKDMTKCTIKHSSPNSYEQGTRWEYRNARSPIEVKTDIGVYLIFSTYNLLWGDKTLDNIS